jgi:hypothetical protein
MKLPGFERKLRVAIDWTLDLFFHRDIVYFRPLHTARLPVVASQEVKIEENTRSVRRLAVRSHRINPSFWLAKRREMSQRDDRTNSKQRQTSVAPRNRTLAISFSGTSDN